MTRPKIYIRDRIYVPVNSVDPDHVKHKYTRHMYKDSSCRQCEYLPDRPCAVCQTCPNYEGVVKLWSVRSIKGHHYIGLPVGDKESLEKRAGVDYDDHEIVDLRRKVPFDYNIKFTAELRPAQVKLASDFLKKKYGLLEAPPRTGKTVMLLYLGLMLGQRMVLLANQHEYLQQFLWHIEGNEAEGIIKCTNLPEIQERSGKKLYGFPKTDEDFATMQLMVMTYQSLASEEKGSNRLKLLSKNVGTVAVDEVHRAGANVFSSILNKFYTRYRFGVTGTVARKDCFVAGSLVKTPLGYKEIDKIVVGDIVQSFNHDLNCLEDKKVVLTHIRGKSQIVRLKHTEGELLCTPDEEFFCVNRNCYVRVCDLTTEDVLQIL